MTNNRNDSVEKAIRKLQRAARITGADVRDDVRMMREWARDGRVGVALAHAESESEWLSN